MSEKQTSASKRSMKIQVSLSKTVIERLNELSADKGVKPSAIMALAIDRFYRTEKVQENQ